MSSVFISYGSPDEKFAQYLYDFFTKNNVKAFYFPESSTPGKKLHHVMRDEINSHDKTILICSKNSLTRKGVLNEIEEVLQKEARHGGEALLIPVMLDKYVLEEWRPEKPNLAFAIRDRVFADFSDDNLSEEVKQNTLRKLLDAVTDETDLCFNTYKISVEICQLAENRASYVIEKHIIVRRGHVDEIKFDDLFSDGSLSIDDCSGGKVIGDNCFGGNRTISVKLDQRHNKGDEIFVGLVMSVENAFSNNLEYIGHRISSPYKSFLIQLKSVVDKPILESWVQETYQQNEQSLCAELSDDRLFASVEIENPKPAAFYKLFWRW